MKAKKEMDVSFGLTVLVVAASGLDTEMDRNPQYAVSYAG